MLARGQDFESGMPAKELTTEDLYHELPSDAEDDGDYIAISEDEDEEEEVEIEQVCKL
jgi:hypothetical protein